MSRPRPSWVVASIGLLGLAQAAITITPASHDFGEATVNVSSQQLDPFPYGGSAMAEFRIALPPGAPRGTTLRLSETGASSGDFSTHPSSIDIYSPYANWTFQTDPVGTPATPTSPVKSCTHNAQGSFCDVIVVFQPSSVGRKTATLVATDTRGYRGTAQLKGKGVTTVICEIKVVSCNYAHLYGGTFGWTSSLSGPKSQYKEHVQVDWANGVASCNGAATSTFEGRSRTGAITGTGLLAVEWLDDPTYPWVYRITAACPTPDWPASADGLEPATPSQPAELGHNDRSSDKQPDLAIKPGMTLQQAIAALATLQGSTSSPAPESDPANGVSGNVTISWNLKRTP